MIDKPRDGIKAPIVLLVGSQEVFRGKGRIRRPDFDQRDGSDGKGPGGAVSREASDEESSSSGIAVGSVAVFHLNFGINVSRILLGVEYQVGQVFRGGSVGGSRGGG